MVRNVLKTNLSLKTISFLFGFFCWFIFSGSEQSTLTLTVPLCFFGDVEQKQVTASPETVQIEISGKRSDLYNLDRESIALHVNLDELESGDHLLAINPEKLFLPATIKLVQWNPSNPVITVVEKPA